MKLSDYVVEFFEEKNIEDVFMLTGGGCMHLVNSFGNSKKMMYHCMHHEQSVAMAAEAYSKFKNDLAIVLVTSGPGSTNSITGLVGAFQDSVPCIFISGQAKRNQTTHNSKIPNLRQFGVQELNIIPIVKSITKYAIAVNDPMKIKYYLQKSLYIAKNGRPGPVWLDIPLDVQSSFINENDLISFNVNAIHEETNNPFIEKDIKYVATQLKHSKRPVVIGGHGIRLASAIDEFEKFLKKSNIPVVTSFLGIDLLSEESKNNIGRVGTKGTRAGNFSMQNADLILVLGSRLAVSLTGHEYKLFAREAKIIVVDIDENEHKKKTIKIDSEINIDVKKFLKKINKHDIGNHGEWLDRCNKWKIKYPVCLSEYDNDKIGINYYKFIDILNKKMKSDMPVISDAGSAFYVVAQGIKLKKNQRYITSGAMGAMGFGIPASIGVSIAYPKHTIITITGDGSFQQNLQELEVIKFHKMPIKIFVMNNNGYFSIRQTQKKFFKGNLVGESDISGISFPKTKKIAEAYNIKYTLVKTIKELEEKSEKFLNAKEPMIIEILLAKDQEIIPTNASLIKEDGTMISKPLEDMYPFLPRDEFLENMIVKPVKE